MYCSCTDLKVVDNPAWLMEAQEGGGDICTCIIYGLQMSLLLVGNMSMV